MCIFINQNINNVNNPVYQGQKNMLRVISSGYAQSTWNVYFTLQCLWMPLCAENQQKKKWEWWYGNYNSFFFFQFWNCTWLSFSAVTLQTFFLGLFCLPSDKDGDLTSEASRWVLQYEYDTIGKQHLHVVINGINLMLLIFVLKADAQPQVVMAQDISLDCLHLTEGFAYFLFIVCRIFCLFKKKNYTHL